MPTHLSDMLGHGPARTNASTCQLHSDEIDLLDLVFHATGIVMGELPSAVVAFAHKLDSVVGKTLAIRTNTLCEEAAEVLAVRHVPVLAALRRVYIMKLLCRAFGDRRVPGARMSKSRLRVKTTTAPAPITASEMLQQSPLLKINGIFAFPQLCLLGVWVCLLGSMFVLCGVT